MKKNYDFKPEAAAVDTSNAIITNVIDLTVESTEENFLVDKKLINIVFGELQTQTLKQFKDQLVSQIECCDELEELLSNIERTIYMKRFVEQDYFMPK